jgi:cytochrome b6-f complex iron-sulfur subunit
MSESNPPSEPKKPTESRPEASSAPSPGSAPAAASTATAKAAPAAAKAKPKAEGKSGTAAKKKRAQQETPAVSRREFFPWLGAAWAVYTASFLAALGAMTRFMFPNVLFEPAMSFKAGFPEEFSVGSVDERFKEKYGVWLVRIEEGIYALSTVCTHLGCTPNWLSNEGKFKCPCHGSGFYMTGINFEGPAPRPLERYRVVLGEDGQVLVDKTKKYQQEKGQWSDPESFLNLA